MSPEPAPTAHLPVFEPYLIASLYEPMRHGEWALIRGETVLSRGYWSPPQLVTDIVALVQGEHTWMSITPMEIESQAIGVGASYGHVAVFGMGMGWSAAASALRREVDAVTIVERDPEVIALHRQLDVFARLPGGVGAKIRVVEGDALAWRPDRPVDVLMPDIWLPLVSDGRVAEVRAMQANVAATAIYFWGQEMEIARHARAGGRALDADGIAATVAAFGLPLIGPGTPDYPERVRLAADAWMGGRWLPGCEEVA